MVRDLHNSCTNPGYESYLSSNELSAIDDGPSLIGEQDFRGISAGSGLIGYVIDMRWKNDFAVSCRNVLAQCHADDGGHVDFRTVDLNGKINLVTQVFHQPAKELGLKI